MGRITAGLALLLLSLPWSAVVAQTAATPESLATQYDFKMGEWTLTARTMKADQTLMEGTGELNVYLVHDGKTQQADMRVEFEDGTGFHGSTMRTLIESEGAWAVTWVQAGGRTAPSGTGRMEGDRVVETFPGEDQFGSYVDSLVLMEITDSSFSVQMDRQYDDGGPLVQGIWQYEATRRGSGDQR